MTETPLENAEDKTLLSAFYRFTEQIENYVAFIDRILNEEEQVRNQSEKVFYFSSYCQQTFSIQNGFLDDILLWDRLIPDLDFVVLRFGTAIIKN